MSARTFETQQVLRTKIPLKSETGAQISPRTRVVVMSTTKEGKVKAKTSTGQRVIAGPGAFLVTFRGRPRLDGKQVNLVKQARKAAQAVPASE